MAENQEYITVEIFNKGLADLKSDLKAEIQVVKDNVLVNSAKIDMLQHTQNVWFMVIAVVVALIGFAITLAPMFRDMYRDSRKDSHTMTEQEIRNIVRDEFTRLKTEAH